MTIRIAIIGAGIMGADHARIFATELPSVRLQVLCDAATDRAKALADQLGAQDVVSNPEAAILRDDVDAVVIASPDHTHAALTLTAINAGKPVLCEKPLSPNMDECIQVMKAEEALGRQMVQLGFMRRFDPSYSDMKLALTDGTLGQALMMHNFHRNVDTPPTGFEASMAITSSACHEFDVARFVLGTEFKSITAFAPAGVAGKVGPVFMVLETVDDQIVNIEVNNNATYGYDVRGELVGEKGSVFLNTPVTSKYNLGFKGYESYPADWRKRFSEAYRLQNKDFLQFVRSGKTSAAAADAWDGYCSTAVAEAGVAALASGQKTAVSLIEKPAFYK
ncbi:myo-inositol 2-dehydrogenase [Parasedimentitalea marina]|uniref:Myo-inositol 2-dehydrogenase n=1 Tax=Parasedimentitalea marina TaxID=2483033 RepID=A0A3T0N3C8_9RHOB|nr:Gfo/Idh/MocA family oxidoreductase [Parasedimentitalea marina]AZV78494.1 myo-inositol 2-dehydrogenase [Parasedimentitalea marina]